MRNNFDLIVVGAGFAGLLAAIRGAQKGKRTAILAKGAGSLAIGGGVVDILGYTQDKKPINLPFEAAQSLPAHHPYTILGIDKLKKSIEYFKKLSAELGYPFISDSDKNSWMPTAIGTLRPTFLRAGSMNPQNLDSDRIIVVGIAGLKDFYPELVIKGLMQQPVYKHKSYSFVKITSPYQEYADLTALDIARQMDKPEGRQWLVNALKEHISAGSSVIIPPVMGTEPVNTIRQELEAELSVKCMETSVMPPSVTGLRMRNMLVKEAKRLNIEYFDMAEVNQADLSGTTCEAIYTTGDKDRKFTAEKYIIATGGLLGGGIKTTPGKAWEQIFKIDLNAPKNQEEWSERQLFGDKQHLFGVMGVSVDSALNPVSTEGDKLLTNVQFIGKSVGGYDYTREKCGNGVALVSAYCTQDED